MKKISVIFATLFLLVAFGNRAQAQCDGVTCSFSIECMDAYGDGWNGNAINVFQGSTLVASVTLTTGAYGVIDVSACSSDSVRCEWETGNYAYEASFNIINGDGSPVMSGVGDSYSNGQTVTTFQLLCPSCPKPVNLTAGNVTSSSASVSWTEGGTAMQWYYSYGTSPEPSGEWVFSSDTQVDLTDLNGNTVYYFFVYSSCGGDDSSMVASFSFRTECGTMALPIVEGFENNGEDVPLCWKVLESYEYNSYGYITVYPYVYMDTWSGLGGTLYLRSGVNQAASVMSPMVPVPANQVEVLLSMAGEDALQVGYVTTDDTATAVFHLVGTVGPTTTSDGYSYEWVQAIVSFDTVTYTDSIWVVLRRAPSAAYSTLQVDNVTIRQIVDCPLPTALTVVEGTPVSGQVDLSWTDAAGSAWQVAYGPQGFDPDAASATMVNVNTVSATITGLDDQTVYDFYVRTVCGTTTGYWVGPVSAKPNLYTLPDTNAVVNFTTCGLNIFHGSYTSGLTHTIVLEPVDDESSIHLTGLASFSGYASYGYNTIRIYAGTDTTGTLLYSLTNDYDYDIDVVSELGPMTICIHAMDVDYEYYLPAGLELYVSCVERAACMTPSGLAVSNITGTTANVSWNFDTSMGEADGFTLYVIDAASGDEVDVVSLAGTERSYELTGLDQRTIYCVRLALDCEGIDTIETRFITVCSVGGEMQVGDGTTTNNYMPTYLYYGNTLSQQIFLASQIGTQQIYGFRFYQTTSGTVTDRLVDVYMDTTSLEAYTDYTDYVIPTADKRVFSGTVHHAQGWVEVAFDTVFDVPAGKNIVLTYNDRTNTYLSSAYCRVTNTTDYRSMYVYRDGTPFDPTDVSAIVSSYSHGLLNSHNTVVFLTPCDESDCLPPTGLTATPDTHSVTLTWTESSSATAYKVEYRHADSSSWTEAVASTTMLEYTVTDLASANNYVFRVSSICADTAIGTTVSALTLCGEYALPLVESFVNFTASSVDNDMELCWYRTSQYPSIYTIYPYLDTWSGYDDSYCMYFGGYNSTLVLPKLEAPVNTLSLDFYMRSSVGNEIEVGVCTNPADMSTYTTIGTYTYMNGDGGWMNVSTYLDSYNGPDGQIYFRTHTSGYTSVYLDNIVVDWIPSCRRIDGALVNNVTTTSIELSIVDQYAHDGYTILWGDTVSGGVTDSLVVTGTTATVTGLTPGTIYHMWVAGNCGTERGEAYDMGLVSTGCLPFAVTATNVYFNEFEAGNTECMWQQVDASNVKWNAAVVGGYSFVGPAAMSGNSVMRLAEMRAGEALLVLPTFDFSGMNGNAELSFYENESSRYYSSMVYDTVDAPSASLAVYYRLSETGPWTLLTNLDNLPNGVWKHRYVELPASQGAPLYQVALKGNPNGNSYGINLDNVKVGPVTTCLAPTDVTVTDITDRTVIVRWTGSGAPTYKVQYRPLGTWNWNARTIEGADTILISPLDMNTDYEVRVCAVCGALELSEYTDVVNFSTALCVDRVERENIVSGSADTVAVNLLGDLERYFTYTEIMVDAAQLTGLSNINGLVFYADSTNNGAYMENCRVYMGQTSQTTMNAFLYDTTFVQVYEGRLSYSATGARNVTFDTPFEWDGTSNVVVGVYVDNYNSYYYAGPTYLAGHATVGNKMYQGYSNNYSGLDLEYVNLLPAGNRTARNVAPDLTFFGCNPVCFEPVINRINTTASSITVNWYNENATVEVAIKLASETTWDAPVTIDNDHRFTFTNLPGMTEFDIRLRRVCSIDDDDYSEWVVAHAMTDTMCSIPTEVSVPTVGAHSATVSWTDGAMSGGKWEIHVWNSDVNLYYDVTTNPATITGLASGSTYRVAVRAYCGSDNHVVGEWSDAVIFENTCHPATDVQVSVTGNDVHLTWTAGERNQQWIVSYGYAGFGLNDQLGYVVVNTNSATFLGLGTASSAMKNNDGGNYGFRVRAICGDDWNSGWSEEVTTGSVGIAENDADAQIAIHPNPATEHVTLTIGAYDGEAEVSVLSVDGRQMYRFTTVGSQLDFDVSTMTAGTYFVRVQTANWTAVRKLIVK